jgi:hypothetical protein
MAQDFLFTSQEIVKDDFLNKEWGREENIKGQREPLESPQSKPLQTTAFALLIWQNIPSDKLKPVFLVQP